MSGRSTTLDNSSAKEAKKSIVYLQVEGEHPETGDKEPSIATGFIISSRGHVVTVSHVLRAVDGSKFYRIRKLVGVVGGGKSTSQPIPLEVVDQNADLDVALLKLADSGRSLVPVTTCKEDPRPGTKLIAYGFPFDTEFSITPGTFSNDSATGGRWQVTMNFTHGMSGGPVYDADGHVRGIVKGAAGPEGAASGEAALGRVIPVQLIDPWLRTFNTPCRCGAIHDEEVTSTPACCDTFLKPLRMHLSQTKTASAELRAFLDRPNLEDAPDYIQAALNDPANLIWRKRAQTLLQHNRDALDLIDRQGGCVTVEELQRELTEFHEHADKVRELWEIILSEQPAPRGRDYPHVRTRFPARVEQRVTQLIETTCPRTQGRMISRLEAKVTMQAGTYKADAVLDKLAKLAGGVVIDRKLRDRIAGKAVIAPPWNEVRLKVVLDQLFSQLEVAVAYEEDGDTVVVQERER